MQCKPESGKINPTMYFTCSIQGQPTRSRIWKNYIGRAVILVKTKMLHEKIQGQPESGKTTLLGLLSTTKT